MCVLPTPLAVNPGCCSLAVLHPGFLSTLVCAGGEDKAK